LYFKQGGQPAVPSGGGDGTLQPVCKNQRVNGRFGFNFIFLFFFKAGGGGEFAISGGPTPPLGPGKTEGGTGPFKKPRGRGGARTTHPFFFFLYQGGLRGGRIFRFFFKTPAGGGNSRGGGVRGNERFDRKRFCFIVIVLRKARNGFLVWFLFFFFTPKTHFCFRPGPRHRLYEGGNRLLQFLFLKKEPRPALGSSRPGPNGANTRGGQKKGGIVFRGGGGRFFLGEFFSFTTGNPGGKGGGVLTPLGPRLWHFPQGSGEKKWLFFFFCFPGGGDEGFYSAFF